MSIFDLNGPKKIVANEEIQRKWSEATIFPIRDLQMISFVSTNRVRTKQLSATYSLNSPERNLRNTCRNVSGK